MCVFLNMCMNELETLDLVPMLSDLPQVALSLYSPYLPRKKKKMWGFNNPCNPCPVYLSGAIVIK